ncbi:hypothetical protein CLOM_g18770 [Closterium sp. NIES-68]|nr:hypothetical protein CLOM_g18770 [Closterium sp. NIES-68]
MQGRTILIHVLYKNRHTVAQQTGPVREVWGRAEAATKEVVEVVEAAGGWVWMVAQCATTGTGLELATAAVSAAGIAVATSAETSTYVHWEGAQP